jgi:hypothetical protein
MPTAVSVTATVLSVEIERAVMLVAGTKTEEGLPLHRGVLSRAKLRLCTMPPGAVLLLPLPVKAKGIESEESIHPE